ncbi:FGGY-family carbohydrate kinase, partial [Arthrobacter sp. VKM Ac-2550]|uniref:FGGY-family carbohydrate kinase n=1 Tax=Crystallibacter permensis TaxID=1938888 RepID=UPI0022278E90
DLYSLTIARWLTTLPEQRATAENYTIPRDVTKRIVLIGGGSRSLSLQSAAADIFGAEVVIPEPAEYVALGAARQAAWALSQSDAPPTWQRREERIIQPSASDDWSADVRGRFQEARRRLYGI